MMAARSRPSKRVTWKPAPEHRDMVATVGRAFGVSALALLGHAKPRPLMRARHGLAFVLRGAFAELSLVDIAQVMGGRGHSTICNALMMAERLRAIDAEFVAITDALLAGENLGAVPPPLTGPGPAWQGGRPRRVDGRWRMHPDEVALANLRFDIELAGEWRGRSRPLRARESMHSQDKFRISPEEVVRRRAAREAEVRLRQIALLEEERRKYGLPKRGRALGEMVL